MERERKKEREKDKEEQNRSRAARYVEFIPRRPLYQSQVWPSHRCPTGKSTHTYIDSPDLLRLFCSHRAVSRFGIVPRVFLGLFVFLPALAIKVARPGRGTQYQIKFTSFVMYVCKTGIPGGRFPMSPTQKRFYHLACCCWCGSIDAAPCIIVLLAYSVLSGKCPFAHASTIQASKGTAADGLRNRQLEQSRLREVVFW